MHLTKDRITVERQEPGPHKAQCKRFQEELRDSIRQINVEEQDRLDIRLSAKHVPVRQEIRRWLDIAKQVVGKSDEIADKEAGNSSIYHMQFQIEEPVVRKHAHSNRS